MDVLELTKEQEVELINILKSDKRFDKYNVIRFELFGFIILYENYQGHQVWTDYGLNYDSLLKIHWFEFLTKTVLEQNFIDKSDKTVYVESIFFGKEHPLDVFKEYKN